MRKLGICLCLLLLSGCVKVGEFPANREKLHNMGGQSEDYCQKNPNRCVDGVVW